ncbi:unnamed protein product [Sphenostylis stenocarpa]|uniref:Uncharacterized protein n=1 Tax=Sphenostylis stenocarpa TaxID=92480 RepID=A0AA86T289_9FABA|nr:unnamed protein product [Sphenostylis stenocarpa]
MLTLLATLALLNLFCLGMFIKQVFIIEGGLRIFDTMALQVLLSGVLVLINIPVYQGLFLRKDKGRLPISVAVQSTTLALSACVLFISTLDHMFHIFVSNVGLKFQQLFYKTNRSYIPL